MVANSLPATPSKKGSGLINISNCPLYLIIKPAPFFLGLTTQSTVIIGVRVNLNA
jgi:hypothetical protein